MNFGIDMGHCLSGPDTGAQAIVVEQIKDREIGKLVIAKLRSLGHTVTDCTVDTAASLDDSLARRVIAANNAHVDRFVSIHLNSGGGQGVEVYINQRGGTSEQVANSVQNALVNLGYHNRGVKVALDALGYNLYVLKNTNAPAILVECGFVDSQVDCALYNANKLADAIVFGLTGQQAVTKTVLVYPGYCLKYNPSSYDANVKALQTALGISADGYFGKVTLAAVQAFQRAHGLNVDGIVGPMTWAKLFN